MKALSLWQPWASAIFTYDNEGVILKPDETRHWPTKVRGTIAIHAAKRKPSLDEMPLVTELRRFRSEISYGCVIGTVDIVDCIDTKEALCSYSRTVKQVSYGNYKLGRWAFVLANPLLYWTPVNCIGRQGFFNV